MNRYRFTKRDLLEMAAMVPLAALTLLLLVSAWSLLVVTLVPE